MKINIILCSLALLSVVSLGRAQDYEIIYQKAREYENKGLHETARAAYELLAQRYPQSKYYTLSKNKVKELNEKISNSAGAQPARLAAIQKPDLNQGRTVKTAVQMGFSLTTAEEKKLIEVTEDFMRSAGMRPDADLPHPDTRDYSVPIPKIEKVYYPPVGKVGQPLFVKVVCTNVGKTARQGGISISFPDRPDNIVVMKSANQNIELKHYPQGSKLFSGAKKVYIISDYPVVETYQWSSIDYGATYSLSTILIPDQSGLLRLFIRSALRGSGQNFYNYPSTGTLDQQSYPVLECLIYVQE
ncbi:hypothetical protein JW906_06025 [bacterium]|nr:hypothetical protein [bacterium]